MKPAKLAIAILMLASAARAAEVADCRLAPGWEQQGPRREFVADNLFEYMDGNAEGYLIYGFTRMEGVTCTSGGDSIIMDVSEMTDADAAYGIFAANRDPNQAVAPIGMGGQILPRRATFCKDKYYVELAANPEKDHTPALKAFVGEMEKRIVGRSTPPDALAWFPTEKLMSARLIPESVLGLRPLKRGYVAQYESGKAFVVVRRRGLPGERPVSRRALCLPERSVSGGIRQSPSAARRCHPSHSVGGAYPIRRLRSIRRPRTICAPEPLAQVDGKQLAFGHFLDGVAHALAT
jgi:hypothetical protein